MHFGVSLGPVWACKRRMAGMMCVVAGLMVSLSAPRGPINRKYTFLRRNWIVGEFEGHFGFFLGT